MSGVQTMKIYSILSKIEQLLDESPKPKFNSGAERRIVDLQEFNDLLGDLKAQIPEDIRRAGGIISERDNTLRNAREKAQDILESAEKEADELRAQAQEAAEKVYQQAVAEYEAMVSENSVYTEACRRAEELQQAAEENADTICNSARAYADDILADVQKVLYEKFAKLLEDFPNMNERDKRYLDELLDHEKKTLNGRYSPYLSGDDDYAVSELRWMSEFWFDGYIAKTKTCEDGIPIMTERYQKMYNSIYDECLYVFIDVDLETYYPLGWKNNQ